MEKYRPSSRTSALESPQQREKKEVLNYWDRDILKTGIQNLTLKMIEDFEGRLPDIIILPDTSARPLMYALRPAFEAIAKEKACPIPQIYFFRTDRSPRLSDMERREERTFESTEELRSYVGSEADYYPITKSMIESNHVEKMIATRQAMQERAQEIMSAEKKKGNDHPSIAIVDEYATGDANTIGEIRKAFGTNIAAYPVFSDSWGGHRVTPGVRVKWNHENANPRTGLFKFSYSDTDSIGVKKTRYDGEKYASRIEPPTDADHAKDLAETKKTLRDEMRSIGKSVSENRKTGNAIEIEPAIVGKKNERPVQETDPLTNTLRRWWNSVIAR